MLTDLGVTAAAGLAAEVVKPRDLIHEEVDNGNDNRYTWTKVSHGIYSGISSSLPME